MRMNKITFCTFFCFLSVFFISCKENFRVITEKNESPKLVSEISRPVYEKYTALNEIIKTALMDDLAKYKNQIYTDNIYDENTQLTYRTEVVDFSNHYYINVFIKKFIYLTPTLEDEYYITFVYNKKKECLETLESVSGMTLSEISIICQDVIFNSLTDVDKVDIPFIKDYIKNGTEPKSRYLNAFTASKKDFTVYFPAGQTLSMYYGPQKVTIKK